MPMRFDHIVYATTPQTLPLKMVGIRRCGPGAADRDRSLNGKRDWNGRRAAQLDQATGVHGHEMRRISQKH